MNMKNAHPWFPQALCLLFIMLKLQGDINWPWLWVLAPFWAAVLLYVFAED